MDSSLPGSSVHGTPQARILEWVAIPFFSRFFWPRDRTPVSCIAHRFFTVLATREAQGLSSVQSLSCVRLFATPWISARLASQSITNSWSPPKPMSIESVMPSNHLILCCPLLLLPSIFPNIRVFSNDPVLHVHWVGDAIQPSHPLSLPSSLALNHSQHQSLFQWVSSGDQSIGLSASASVLPMNTQGSAQAPFTGSAES